MGDLNTYRQNLGLPIIPLTPAQEEERKRQQELTQPISPEPNFIDPYREALGLSTSPMYQRRHGIPSASEKQASGLLETIAASDDPMQLINQINSSRYLAEAFKIDQGVAFSNLEELSKTLMTKALPPHTLGQRVQAAWKSGVTTFEAAILADKWMKRGGDDPAIEAELARLEKSIVPFEEYPSGVIKNGLLWAAQSGAGRLAVLASGAAMGVASGATAGAMLGAAGAPLTAGLSVPAMAAAVAAVGWAVGASKMTIAWMSGMQYLDLRKSGAPHRIAAPLGLISGTLQAIIETAQIVAVLPKIPGFGAIFQGAASAAAKKIMASGMLTTIGARMATRAIGISAEEGIENGLQELASIATEQIARELAKNQRIATQIKPQTWDAMFDRLKTSIYQGAAAGFVMGGVNVLQGLRMDVGEKSWLNQAARVINNKEKFIETAKAMNIKPENLTETKYQESLGQVWEQQRKKEEAKPSATPAAPTEVPPFTTPEGLPYTVTEKGTGTKEGTNATLAVGNPETGERYGHLTYETIGDSVYVQDVVSEGKQDYTRAMILDLAARHPGLPIEWNPIDEASVVLKADLVANNPRGPDEGLQWFEAKGPEVQGILTRDVLKRRIQSNFNSTPDQSEHIAVLCDVLAGVEGITTDQWLNKYIDPRVVSKTPEAQAELIAHQATAAAQFTVDNKGMVKGLFVTLGKSDFHHVVHEWFHIVETLALSPETIRKMEVAVGEMRGKWTTEIKESLANHFEDYLGTGVAPTPALESVFKQIAAGLWKLVSYVTERAKGLITLSPEFKAAYDSMFAKPESGLAKAAQETPAARAGAQAKLPPYREPPPDLEIFHPAPKEVTPDWIRETYIKQEQKPGQGSWEGGVIGDAATSLAKQWKAIPKGWTNWMDFRKNLSSERYQGVLNDLRELAKMGAIQKAWDQKGEVYYAKQGEALREGLTQNPADIGTAAPPPGGFALMPSTEEELKAKKAKQEIIQQTFGFAKKTDAEMKDEAAQLKLFHAAPEEVKAFNEKAVKAFGVTSDPEVGAWLLSDGRMLNFTTEGRPPVNEYGAKRLPHTTIRQVLDEKTLNPYRGAWRMGALRIEAGNGLAVIESVVKPNEKQLKTIGKWIAGMKTVEIELKSAGDLEETLAYKTMKNPTLDTVEDFYIAAEFYSPKALYHPDAIKEADPWLYKALEVVNQKIQGPMLASQIKKTMIANGVKAEEMKWTGLDDFLAEDRKLTPEELRNFIGENAVRLVEVSKIAPSKAAIISGSAQDDMTKFSSYQLPGGTNYTELLIMLPAKAGGNADEVIADLYPGRQYNDLTHAERRNVDTYVKEESGVSPLTYASPHWNEKNVIAHIRTNDRVVPTEEGKPASAMLFIEEIQSDWHQAGREKGYKGKKPAYAPETQVMIDEVLALGIEKPVKDIAIRDIEQAGGSPDLSNRWFAAMNADELKPQDSGAVPAAPFSKTWHELSFRRALRMAVEKGYEAVGWTTGEQQAARYDLSNQIGRLDVEKQEDGLWALSARTDEGIVVMEKQDIVEADLPGIVGKEMAQKIVERGGGAFEDLDLKVGGEGMAGFYDRILVEYANKIGKKWDAQVKDAELVSGKWRLEDFRGNVMATSPNREEVERQMDASPYGPLWIVPPNSVVVHSFPITPAMAEGIKCGQYLFHYDPLWNLEFLYGTSIDQGVYDRMVEEAAPFGSPEAFQAAVVEQYGEPHEGDIATTEADTFWKEVWDQAHPKLMTTEEANAQFIDFLKAEDYRGVYAVLAAIGGSAKSVVPQSRKGGVYAKRVGIHRGLSPFMRSLAGRVANTGKDISPKSLKSMFTIMSKEPTYYRIIYAESTGDQQLQAQIQHEQGLTPPSAEPPPIAMPEATQATYDFDTKLETAKVIEDDSLGSKMATGEAKPSDLDNYVDKKDAEIAQLREKVMAVREERDAAVSGLAEADRKLIDAGERALAEESIAIEEEHAFAEGMQKMIAAYRLRLQELEASDKLAATKAKLYASKRAALEKLRADVRAKTAEKRAVKKYKEARSKLIADIMRPPGKNVEFVDYAEQIREIQRGLDLQRHRRTLEEKLAGAKNEKQAEKIREEHRTTIREERAASRAFFDANPEAVALVDREKLDAIYAVPVGEMSLAQLEQIASAIDNLSKLGKLKRSIKVGKALDVKKAHITDVAGAVLRGKPPEEVIGAAKPGPRWFKAITPTWKPDRMAQLFDGWKETGPNRELLQDKPNEAWSNYKKASNKRLEAGSKKLAELKLTMDQLDPRILTQGFTWIGKQMDIEGFRMSNGKSPTIDDVIYWYRGMMNDDNTAALLHGNKFPLSVMLKGISQLTKEQQAWGDWMAGDMQSRFSKIRSTFIELFNIDLKSVINYFTMNRLEKSYENLESEVATELMFRSGISRESVARNPTFERIEIADMHQKPIRTDATGVWMDHVKVSEGFIHQYAMVRDLQSIYRSDQVRAAMRQRYGEAANKWVMQYLNDLSQSEAYKSMQGVDKFSRMMRGNAAISWLAFNILPNLKQLTGFLGYLGDAGPVYLVSAAAQYAAGQGKSAIAGKLLGNALVDFVEARSELVRNRQITQELEDLKRTQGGIYMQLVKKIGTAGMQSLQIIDKVTCVIGWKAVYDKVKAKTQNEAAAIKAADEATVRTQPSARVQDMAEMYRSGEVMKWFTMFTSELSASWNRLSFDVPQSIRNMHIERAVGDLVAFALVGAGIAVAGGGLAGGDDEKKKKQMMLGLMSQFVTALPIVGNDLFSWISGKSFQATGVKLLPSIDLAGAIISELKAEDYDHAIGDAIEAAAFISGLPVSGPKKAIRFLGSGQVTDLLGWKVK